MHINAGCPGPAELAAMPIQNAEIAAMFDQTADLLELRGENPFRVRAYRRAARTVESLAQSVPTMLGQGIDLTELPGIGKDLAGKMQAEVAKLPAAAKGDLASLKAQVGETGKTCKACHDDFRAK